jgi:uncharacterized membrane protein (DUF4010 family)
MEEQQFYIRFVVALAIGLAIGIERGWQQREEPSGKRETGVRTFTILSLTGFAAASAVGALGPMFVAVVAVGVFALIAIAYSGDILQSSGDRGATTEVAAVLTFVLGALAAVGEELVAGVVAVVLIAILDQKKELHGFLQRLQKLELTAAVKLLLVSVVLLPALPNEGYGPGRVLNPYELWWAVVVIAALGFAGYAAIKAAGPRHGALFMGLVGGLVSSTAVTVNASRASKEAPKAAMHLAAAVATAQSVMFIRTGALIAVLNASLLDHAIVPLAVGALVAIAGALIVARRAAEQPEPDDVESGTPDTLGSAIRFVVVVAVVLVVAHYAQAYAGDPGLMLSGLLSGAVDVDAATVSASRLAGAQLHEASVAAAAASIAAALVANSFVKACIAYSLGARAMFVPAAAVLASSGLAALLGGGVMYLMLPQ